MEQVHWATEHRSLISKVGIAVAVLLALGVGIWLYLSHQEELASAQLSAALRTYETPVRPAGTPETPDYPSFASLAERGKKAHEQFQAIASQYSHTRSGEFARYFSGLTAMEMNDNAGAERDLKEVADHSNANVSSLAKMALASLYRNTARDPQAIELYKQVIDKPALTVSKQAAQVELASLYVTKGEGADARRIYEQLQKENPGSEIGALAATKIQELSRKQ
jgi:predicted negative regulator of RcsB-dependent stress response